MNRRPPVQNITECVDRQSTSPRRPRRTGNEIRKAVLQIVTERDGQCLHLDYRNRNSWIVLRCANGHVWRTRVKAILQGSWCFVCARNRRVAAVRAQFGVLDLDDADEIAFFAESQGLTFVASDLPKLGRSDFYKCEQGHLWEVSRAAPSGPWCPVCGLRGTVLGVGRIVQ